MGWNEQALKSNGKSKLTSIATECSQSTGPTLSDTEIFEPLIGEAFPESICYAEAFHASLSLSPDSDEARTMTAISGRKCALLCSTPSPLGLLLRMCLASSALRSTRCFLTWRPQAMKSGRWLFRLVPSVPRTYARESGFLPTLRANKYGLPDSHGSVAAWNQYLLPTLKACDGAKGIRTPEGAARERLRRKNGQDLPTVLGGRVHPAFAEWMFGYPTGWTELPPSEIASSRKSRNGSGGKS